MVNCTGLRLWQKILCVGWGVRLVSDVVRLGDRGVWLEVVEEEAESSRLTSCCSSPASSKATHMKTTNHSVTLTARTGETRRETRRGERELLSRMFNGRDNHKHTHTDHWQDYSLTCTKQTCVARKEGYDLWWMSSCAEAAGQLHVRQPRARSCMWSMASHSPDRAQNGDKEHTGRTRDRMRKVL